MANSQNSIISVVGILAIVILVGLAIYFVMRESDDDFEVDVNGQVEQVDEGRLAESPAAPPPVEGFALGL